MTANQINYQKYLEDVRSHKASESISGRQAAAAERQAESAAKQADVALENAVTNRMNAETNKANSLINESAVGAQWYGAQANRAYQETMASVSQAQQLETQRHNQTLESQDMIKQGQNITYEYYKTQKQVEQQEKDRLQRYVQTGADFLLGVGKALIPGAIKLLGG